MLPLYYTHLDAGAPSLNNAPGSLLEILRACGIAGFNNKPVTSISVAAGVATATAAAHGFQALVGQRVTVTGAPEAGLNGDQQPTAANTNTFSYPAPGVPDGTYTGTISARRTPFGLTELHSAGNVAIFGRSSLEATPQLLRIDDSGASPASATYARVVQVEAATGVNAFTAASPTADQSPDGFAWHKGPNSTAPKRWAIFTDGLMFYLLTPAVFGSEVWQNSTYAWGDPVPAFAADPWRTLLCGEIGLNSGQHSLLNMLGQATTSGNRGMVFARRDDGIAASPLAATFGNTANAIFGDSFYGPTRIDSLLVTSAIVGESEFNGRSMRGLLPGVFNPMARAPFATLPDWSEIAVGADRYVSARYQSVGREGNALFLMGRAWR